MIEVLRRPVEFTLNSVVAVMDQAVEDLTAPGPVPHRHLEGVDGEVRAQGLRDLPADHHPRKHVDDERGVDPAGMGLDVGEIGHPEPVGLVGTELSLDDVGRAVLTLVEAGGHLVGPAPSCSREAQLTHQALHGAAGHADPLSVELGPDLVGPIDLEVVAPDRGRISPLSSSSRTERAEGGRFLATQ